MRTPWRLTKIWKKTIYIVGGRLVLTAGFFALRTWVIDAFIVVGVRNFRGYLEPLASPRLWWRMTGRPKGTTSVATH